MHGHAFDLSSYECPMKHATELRPICDDDREFLFRVYASTRDEVVLLPWSDAEKEAFLRMQFNAQNTHYQGNYPDAQFDVVSLDGVPIGRLYIERQEEEIRIIDIALLPKWRGQGIGSSIMSAILSEAANSGKAVTLHVLKNSFARPLYDRLGFSFAADATVYDFLRWQPNGQVAGDDTFS